MSNRRNAPNAPPMYARLPLRYSRFTWWNPLHWVIMWCSLPPPREAPSAMTNSTSTPSAGSAASRFLPLLLLLFAGSGCSALIYEIVWYQLLQLAMGSTTVSLAFLLATYMGGLCIGSIWLPRFKRARQHPLKVYAALELGIAIFGILVLILLPIVNRIYVAGVEHGLPGML